MATLRIADAVEIGSISFFQFSQGIEVMQLDEMKIFMTVTCKISMKIRQ